MEKLTFSSSVFHVLLWWPKADLHRPSRRFFRSRSRRFSFSWDSAVSKREPCSHGELLFLWNLLSFEQQRAAHTERCCCLETKVSFFNVPIRFFFLKVFLQTKPCDRVLSRCVCRYPNYCANRSSARKSHEFRSTKSFQNLQFLQERRFKWT